MALSKNNTKGNGVLLQNIVLKKKSCKRERNGALYFHLLKSTLEYDFGKACRLVTLLSDQQKDRSDREGAGEISSPWHHFILNCRQMILKDKGQ